MSDRKWTEKDVHAAKELGVCLNFELNYLGTHSGKCTLRCIVNGDKHLIHTARGETKWYSPNAAIQFVFDINDHAHFSTRIS